MSKKCERERKYLKWNMSRGLSWIHQRGYSWFVENFLPAINTIENSATASDKKILADAHYFAGDVHFMNNALCAAIKEYEKSLLFCPDNADVIGDIGWCYSDIGKYRKAIIYLKRALLLDPDDPYVLDHLEDAKINLAEKTPPLNDNNNISWKVNEYLAQNKPGAALKIVLSNYTLEGRKCRMRVYGAMNDVENLMNEWRGIIENCDMISMGFDDLFYISEKIGNSREFWELYHRGANKFDNGVMDMHESLWDHINPKKRRSRQNSKASMNCLYKYIRLYAEYRLAEINRDYQAALKLSKAYPVWTEAACLAKSLGKIRRK